MAWNFKQYKEIGGAQIPCQAAHYWLNLQSPSMLSFSSFDFICNMIDSAIILSDFAGILLMIESI